MNIIPGVISDKLGIKPKTTDQEDEVVKETLIAQTIGKWSIETSNNGSDDDYETCIKSALTITKKNPEGFIVLERYGIDRRLAQEGHEKWKAVLQNVSNAEEELLSNRIEILEEDESIEETNPQGKKVAVAPVGVVQQKRKRERLGESQIGMYQLDTSNNNENDYLFETSIKSPLSSEYGTGWVVVERYGENKAEAKNGHNKWKMFLTSLSQNEKKINPEFMKEIEELQNKNKEVKVVVKGKGIF